MAEVQPGRILSDENGVRYVELSSSYSSFVYAMEQKVAGFDGTGVGLIVNEATVVLTEEEFAVLVASYQRYKADEEQRQAEVRARWLELP